jgi:hypothetical protein
VEKTISLALLGVVIGRVLGIPWYAAFAAGAPALGLSAVMAAALYGLSVTLPPGAALAVGIPLGAALYLMLLRRVVPEAFAMVAKRLLPRSRARATVT